MNRLTQLNKIKTTDYFDVCVIGGGASGAGVALDATLRGYKVILIEKNDFGGETSSRSTKLIHGGVRYLEQAVKKFDFGQLKQVRHGLAERRFLLQNAPHLTKPLAIVTPVFHWLEGLYYSIGLKIYGLFSQDAAFPSSKWLSKKQTLEFIPTLSNRLQSAVMYYDGQLDDARYTLALVQSAEKNGAVVLNHAAVTSFEIDEKGKLSGAKVVDALAEKEVQINARVFVNCTGPFADTIRLMANPNEQPRIRPSKGVHIVLPSRFLASEKAVLIPKTKDGRLIFVIPFQHKVLIGTTDTPYENTENEPILEEEEVSYLLETVAPYFTQQPTKNEVEAGFGGLRPLISAKSREGKQTKTLLRDHEVEGDTKSGLISLLGGKWTTYRLMAEDTTHAIDTFLKKGGIKPCQTKNFRLVGAQNLQFDVAHSLDMGGSLGLTKEECLEMYQRYGDQLDVLWQIMQEDTSYLDKLHPAFTYRLGEVVYASRYEMAMTLRDFFARRIRLEILDWSAVKESMRQVADVMGKELGWALETKELEINRYESLLSDFEVSASIKDKQ
ncbi:MAG: glycerol-3-phosphate dehydrogenase/oxidase [Spirosomataceae bacterium]